MSVLRKELNVLFIDTLNTFYLSVGISVLWQWEIGLFIFSKPIVMFVDTESPVVKLK